MKKYSNIWVERGYEAGLVAGFKKGVVNRFKKVLDERFKESPDKGLVEAVVNRFKERIEAFTYEELSEGVDEEVNKEIEECIEYLRRKTVEKQRTSAVKMIKDGITIGNISKYTGLSIEEIAELKKKVENGEL